MTITEAEKKIAAILKQLEIDSGSVVKSISLDTIEMTNLGDVRPQMMQRVLIELERAPGNRWVVE